MLNRRSALAALTAAASSRAPRDAEDVLAEAAHREGAVTWYRPGGRGRAAEEMGRRFTEAHPGITVAAIRTTGQVAYQRLVLELKNSAPQCDVLSTTDISHMPALKERNALLHYEPPNAAALLPEFRRLSDPGWYYPTGVTNHFLAYNTRKVTAAECTAAVDRFARSEMEKPDRAAPSGVQRLRRRLGRGSSQTVWLGVL